MKIVHIQGEELKPERKKALTQDERVQLRIQRMSYANYLKSLKKYDAKIKEVQKRIPGWMPPFTTERILPKHK